MPLKALVFDLDGTLVDQEGAERDALLALYERDLDLKAKPGYPAFLRDWREVAEEYLRRFLENRMGFEEQRRARFLDLYEKYGEPCPPEKADRLSRTYARYYSERWRAYGDTRTALERLSRRFTLAVLTNGDGAQQRAKLEATRLTGFFADILVSGDVKVGKPDPAIFRLSEQKLGLPPSSLAYIGDRLDMDVVGARAAGWTAVWLDRKGMPGRASESQALVAGSLLDLESLFPQDPLKQ